MVLSKKLEDHQFSLLLEASALADKARLLSVSAPHAASWLLVTPSPGLDLHLDPNELQISIQWWLGIDTARGSSCSLCPGLALDRLGNHATTSGSLSEGAAAEEAEVRKHRANDPKCSGLGWVCIPLAVETYGNWGREVQSTFSRLASHLAIITSSHKGMKASDTPNIEVLAIAWLELFYPSFSSCAPGSVNTTITFNKGSQSFLFIGLSVSALVSSPSQNIWDLFHE
eukprot:Em0001g3042a